MRSAEDDQAETVAFLSNSTAYGSADEDVRRVTTHISRVFLVGERAYKLKRAVRLPYLDFTTPESRRAACEREIELNRRTAPSLYLGVQPICRGLDGRLALSSLGDPVDWLVVMRRFAETALFDRMAEGGLLEPKLLRDLADSVAAFHASAERVPTAGGALAMKAIVDGNDQSFAACPDAAFDPGDVARLQSASRERLRDLGRLLDRRRDAGKVRRCHGDLHLRNICLIDGRPTLFDCLEFSDELATIDVLYDLAFLLMDLLHRGLPAEANTVFNRYLDNADETDGVAALPLFLSVRAAIRAHAVAIDASDGARLAEAKSYLSLALRLIDPPPPRLIAIGGLSGTGKSTIALGLAPGLGAMPGARVIRSDAIRKRLFGVPPEQRLGREAYLPGVTERVYASIGYEAEALLVGGHAVVLDAVFAQPRERAAVRELAQQSGVRFDGFWLEAPMPVLERRIAGRRDDASDADVEILHRQATYDIGVVDWKRIDASAGQDQVLAEISASLT
jgi:aminoglycoside phosphotransferase family enzyme/predicted kinase